MLEQIHSAPEDRRTTQIAVSLSAVSFGAIALADALVTQAPAEAALGTLVAAAGAAALAWIRRTPVRTD
jgi:peptidoglycan/LPS O-acetylase OafA/YrhL